MRIDKCATALFVLCFCCLAAPFASSAAPSGQAEIYHCRDDRGRMALSDRPCDDEEEFVEMRTIETYGSPSNIPKRADPESVKRAAKNARKARNKTAVAATTPAPESQPEKECKKPDNSPWINPVGMDC